MNLLMCPVCRQALFLHERTWRCEQGHSYDLAKQGYVNLHVVQHKHSKSPGDTTDSVTARRAFLSDGFYQPLRDALVEIVRDLAPKSLVDIGCGEGYYTAAMAAQVDACVGLDIAKTAIQRAARVSHKVTWVVATGAVLPVLDQSVELCSSVFSPIPKGEILRVLKPEGYVLIARPAADHLYAMREALFDQVHPHQPDKFIEQLQPDFKLISTQSIQAELCLSQAALKNLIAMTPYAYKASQQKRERLEQQDQFKLNACFELLLLQKTALEA